jgi:hypothetical protein
MVISLLRALRAVFRTTLHAALHADRVERAAHDVIAHAGQILDAAAADEHERMLLQVVADPRNVRGDLDAVGQADARHLAERGVRLLRRLGEDAHADPALLRAVLQRRALRLADDFLAARTDKLADSRHTTPQQNTRRAAATLRRMLFQAWKPEAWRLKTLRP